MLEVNGRFGVRESQARNRHEVGDKQHEDGVNIFVRNLAYIPTKYMASYPRR
jgi:hypothetical protein